MALVGAGEVGLRLAIEFCKSEDEVMILPAETRPTNYSNEDLKKNLKDGDAVVLTFWGLLCRELPRCKYFIPSEWHINIENFPDQPMFSSATRGCSPEATFIGYIPPQGQNPLREVELAWAMKHGTKVFDVYGDGLQKVTLTSLGDVARVVVAVLRNSITTGSDFHRRLIRSLDSVWKSNAMTFSEVLDAIYKRLQANDDGVALHQMRIFGFTNANHIPEEKALEWGTGVLQGLHAISVEELLEKAKARANP
ncbi:hypothetical protein BDV39DRAFT_188382 [Aspergillus sergii]|uniref:NmrA-like domain-containing protein n=1 Tax=Aspergillus sergii TaxID=1034303 RepID=A0A5N6XJ42_9EURO|nr:hypothetical protein BDV39DRAFT_188382 [Aspergillus sergii]